MRSGVRDRHRRAAVAPARGFCLVQRGAGLRDVAAEEPPRYRRGADTASGMPPKDGWSAPNPADADDSSAPDLDWLHAPRRDRADGAPTADEALAALTAALELAQAVDWDAEPSGPAAAAPVLMHQMANRLAAAQVAALGAVDRRGLIAVDGAVSLAALLRARTFMEPGTATRMVGAARRLSFLPNLSAAFAAGEVSLAHVTTITQAAGPSRAECFRAADATFTELAKNAPPSKVRVAVRFLADHIDPDGSKPKKDTGDWTGKDGRRHFDVWDAIDGLLDGRLLLDQLDGELLRTLLDAFDKPDPPDTPEHLQRSPAQWRADAFAAMLQAAAASNNAPTVHGAEPHALAMFDLARFMGRPELATFPDRLRYGGQLNMRMLARLLDHAMVTVVLTFGPWRVVNVGRTYRTLPAALRPMLQMLHSAAAVLTVIDRQRGARRITRPIGKPAGTRT